MSEQFKSSSASAFEPSKDHQAYVKEILKLVSTIGYLTQANRLLLLQYVDEAIEVSMKYDSARTKTEPRTTVSASVQYENRQKLDEFDVEWFKLVSPKGLQCRYCNYTGGVRGRLKDHMSGYHCELILTELGGDSP